MDAIGKWQQTDLPSLDLSFFKGVEKTNDEYGETINPENNFFNKKSRTLSFADGA
jgi:hypothetical protein